MCVGSNLAEKLMRIAGCKDGLLMYIFEAF